MLMSKDLRARLLASVAVIGCGISMSATAAPQNVSNSETVPQPAAGMPSSFYSTNPPAISFNVIRQITNIVRTPRITHPIPTNLPPQLRARLATNSWYNPPVVPPTIQVRTLTNTSFVSYFPNSLNELIWTNFLARTNGRSTAIWSVRSHPSDWPKSPPLVAWNTNSLMWGLKGITALSPCWEGEGAPGQVPITALTRRHGYTRGHGMGPSGISTQFSGKKVWFASTDNRVIETSIRAGIVRLSLQEGRDYTVFLFDRDLPDSVQPLRVGASSDVWEKYVYRDAAPRPIFMTEQSGNVSTGIPPFVLDTLKGGDSGSPNLLPMPDELLFLNGRTTSGPSPAMQADMDELCRRAGLDPANYQLQWADLSRYPSFK